MYSLCRSILYMWIFILSMDILVEEPTLRPLEDNGAWGDAGGWSKGTRQENHAVSWWLSRTVSGCWTVHVLWGKWRDWGVSSSGKGTNINLLLNSCLWKWSMQLFHVTVYSLSCRRFTLLNTFYLFKVCPYIVESKMFVCLLKEDEALL